MKFLVSLVFVLPLISQAAEQPFNAYCELQKSKGSHFRGYPFARLLASPQESQLYKFSSIKEAEAFTGVSEDLANLFKARLEKAGKKREFAVPSLETAKASAGTALVYKVKNKVFENPEAYRGTGRTFSLEAEYRDFDDDYSGVFFWTHGYVVMDSGTFTCVVL